MLRHKDTITNKVYNTVLHSVRHRMIDMNTDKKHSSIQIPKPPQTQEREVLRQHGTDDLSDVSTPKNAAHDNHPFRDGLNKGNADFAEIEIEYDYGSAGVWVNETAQRLFSIPVPARQQKAPVNQQQRYKDTGRITGSAIIDKYAPRADNAAIKKTASQKLETEPGREKPVDPIREKFSEMRAIVGTYPFLLEEGESFYKQARFMEDFIDDYDGNAVYSTYYPHYMHMGYEQLRTYFTWRTKVRAGETEKTSTSYAFIYIYELLCNIGVSSHEDGLDKLLAFWKAYGEVEPSLEKYVPQWIKDYHIYYELPQSFTDFVKENGLNQYYRKMFLYDDSSDNIFDHWSGLSSYKVTGSRFYRDGNEELLKQCFEAVYIAICKYCEDLETSFGELFNYHIRRGVIWKPFQRAVFYDWLKQHDRRVILPGNEEYYCDFDKWIANIPVRYKYIAETAGYIIKKTEACLRSVVKYKYLIKADPRSAQYFFHDCRKKGVTQKGLDAVIEEAVSLFYAESTRTVVTVNSENLERIREEAQGTQEKLTVNEDGEVPIERSVGESVNDESATDEFNHDADAVDRSEVLQFQPATWMDRAGDGWAALKAALGSIELEVLKLISNDASDAAVRAFAIENGVMPEVLAAEINEKAADSIGDTILEADDGLKIYQEYAKSVTEMVMSDE